MLTKQQGDEMPEDLKLVRQESLALFTSEEAGTILGVLLAGLVLIDLAARALQMVFG